MLKWIKNWIAEKKLKFALRVIQSHGLAVLKVVKNAGKLYVIDAKGVRYRLLGKH